MSELRKAAEMVLKAWDKWKGGPFEREMEFLRQALAQPDEVLAEREACAKLCDHWPYGRDDLWSLGQAIRARGKK